MNDYYSGLTQEKKAYFHILEPNFPNWLHKYINTPVMLHQQYISTTCGLIYTKLIGENTFYSSLDHSVGVALIVWHFTKDKKQTIAALLHDIATPVFKHCVDFLEGDHLTQESTEGRTTDKIRNSAELMNLLKRDHIDIAEIDDYHVYPIADNEKPHLAADRLEYSFANAFFTYHMEDLEKIEELYNDIEIQTNEDGIPELGFRTKRIARGFVKITSQLSILYRNPTDVYSMQFLADILKRLEQNSKITRDELYTLKENEIITIIENSNYADVFKKWREAEKIKVSKEKPKNVYSVKENVKIRWIDPLFQGRRMSKACKIAKSYIDRNLAYAIDGYCYLDFNF